MHPQYCAKEVLRAHANVGFALDGDADRVVVIDERTGTVVLGAGMLALFTARDPSK